MDIKISDASYSVFTNKGVFALLLGSGISRNAGIPTGWEITINLIKQVAILEKQNVSANLDEWYEKYFQEKPDYSNIIEKLASTREERLNLLKPFFEPTTQEFEDGLKRPTIAHRKIASLIQAGYIKVIVTTNFDRLLENSLKDIGIEPVVISNPAHVDNTVPLIHNQVTILKINGDYLDTGFLNIKSELATYDKRIENLLSFVFENFGIITCGWSAQWDIALVDIIKAANKYRYSTYCTFTSRAPGVLEELCRFRHGKLLQIQSADHLFSELFENVQALERGLLSDPISPQIALARVKKYLSNDEHVISLSDLVKTMTESVFRNIANITLPTPTEEVAKEILNSQIAFLDPLLPLLIEGGYWGREPSLAIWLDSIKRLGSFPDSNSSYSIWQDMKYVPLIFCRYAFGLGCLANGRFENIGKLCQIRLRKRLHREFESLLAITHTWRVLDAEQLRAIEGERYYTPMSELLFNRLRKYFIHIVPSDEDFADLFDYYEYICCLLFLKEVKDDYPPTGRFAWRNNNFIAMKIKEIGKSENDFELIRSGLLTKDEINSGVLKIQEAISRRNF